MKVSYRGCCSLRRTRCGTHTELRSAYPRCSSFSKRTPPACRTSAASRPPRAAAYALAAALTRASHQRSEPRVLRPDPSRRSTEFPCAAAQGRPAPARRRGRRQYLQRTVSELERARHTYQGNGRLQRRLLLVCRQTCGRFATPARIAPHATAQTASHSAKNILITVIDCVLSIDAAPPQVRGCSVSVRSQHGADGRAATSPTATGRRKLRHP
jgi:hypothetical protein